MLIAASDNPTLAAYRDEILFEQTIKRYGNAWHHREPFWYFLVEVIPALWLPLTLLVPWLFVHWRDALRSFDLRIALLASWIVLVVLFFSFSTGKRGVYVLPAVPALALLCAPYLAQVATRRGAQRAMFVLAAVASGLCAATWIYLLVRPDRRADIVGAYGLDPLGPPILMTIAGAVICAIARPRRGFLAFGGVLATALLIVSFWVNPQLNDARSGAVVRRAHRASCRSAARARPGRVQGAIRSAGAPPDRALRSCALARSRPGDGGCGAVALRKTRASTRHQRRRACGVLQQRADAVFRKCEPQRVVSGARGSGSVVRRPRQATRRALLLAAGPGTRLSS